VRKKRHEFSGRAAEPNTECRPFGVDPLKDGGLTCCRTVDVFDSAIGHPGGARRKALFESAIGRADMAGAAGCRSKENRAPRIFFVLREKSKEAAWNFSIKSMFALFCKAATFFFVFPEFSRGTAFFEFSHRRARQIDPGKWLIEAPRFPPSVGRCSVRPRIMAWSR